jgi:hypothetical protein
MPSGPATRNLLPLRKSFTSSLNYSSVLALPSFRVTPYKCSQLIYTQALHPHQMEKYNSQIPAQKCFSITAKVLLPQWFFIPFMEKQKARNWKDDMNTHIKRTRFYS